MYSHPLLNIMLLFPIIKAESIFSFEKIMKKSSSFPLTISP